jgi:hypothetical protein
LGTVGILIVLPNRNAARFALIQIKSPGISKFYRIKRIK